MSTWGNCYLTAMRFPKDMARGIKTAMSPEIGAIAATTQKLYWAYADVTSVTGLWFHGGTAARVSYANKPRSTTGGYTSWPRRPTTSLCGGHAATLAWRAPIPRFIADICMVLLHATSDVYM